jgi:formylglycine-generating enzyme required for sulfatase activity
MAMMRFMSCFTALRRVVPPGKAVGVVVVALAALTAAAGCAGVLGIDDPDVVGDGGGIMVDAADATADGSGSMVDAADATADGGGSMGDAADAASGPPSCPSGVSSGVDGVTNCGFGGNESCCTSLEVDGGLFYRSYDGTSAYPNSGAPASVSGFRLDKYEVTVGRFRNFVTATQAPSFAIAPFSGKQISLNGGHGLEDILPLPMDASFPPQYESGWLPMWNNQLPTTLSGWQSVLSNCSLATWSSTGGDAKKPINCVSWYEAYAFCIWDGGYLPSEAEWDYAAQGGPGDAGQRAYPWSNPSDSTQIDCSRANFAGGVDGGPCNQSGPNRVGSYSPVGDALWGPSDLAGNVGEWTLDWYSPEYVVPCSDCADLGNAAILDAGHSVRGGSYSDPAAFVRAAYRSSAVSLAGESNIGFRCARAP